MIFKKSLSAGLLYRSSFFYALVTWLKLGSNKNLRFKIASQFISPGESVLDVASGGGWLREHIPASCSYTCVEAGDTFLKSLTQRGVKFIRINLHQGIGEITTKFDIVVMIISLYQFRHTSLDQLLSQFKEMANKVVIIEEVALAENDAVTYKDKLLNFLCQTDYFMPTKILSAREFTAVCTKHGYQVEVSPLKNNYMIATYAHDRASLPCASSRDMNASRAGAL